MEHKYADRLEHFEERNHLRLCSIESSAKSRTRYKRIQSTCYNFLERPNGILSISYHFALFGLVVVGLVFAILETMDELKNNNGLILSTYILELFLLIVFSSEYILRMWSAGCRSTYSGFLGRLRFAFKPFVIVDIVVIASTFGVIVYSSGKDLSSSVSILRFFQVLRMVRFDRQGGSWKLVGSVIFLHKQELLTTFYIGFCSLIFASFFVYQAESLENAAEFGTFADSFWWGVVTLTTVGYGDKVPKSWAGRGIAAFFAIMGISFFALPAGILGSGFALKVSQHQRQKHVKRRRRPAAMLIQCNWRYYASRKNSKLIATWSPYIKHLQETNSKKVGPIPEKTSQPVGRVRKISIFGRKSSGLSADGIHRPENTITEQAKQRNRKVVRNDMFQSNDSLHDGHSNSTADQHTDDEHGSNHVRHKPILVTDAGGNMRLPSSYKQSIRFTRYLKFLVALRKFKLAKKPYDVKDVIEQYTTGHVEVLGKVKSIGNKIDEALGYKVGTEKVNENQLGRTNVVHRLSKLEKQVKSLETKLDQVITLLEDCKRKPLVPSLSEERRCCSMCGHNYDNSQHSEQHSSEELQSKENISSHESEKPVRRRKVAMSNPHLNRSCLSEREEPVSNEDLRSRASLKSGQNLDQCLNNNNYGGSSLQIETDGRNYLSPGYGYEDGASLSRQSSAYGISDNCPSPNPSSSDESYHSKDDDHHHSHMLLQSDGMLPLYSESYQSKVDHHDDQIPSDGTSPLYGQSYHAPEHGTVVDIPVHGFISPDHELYGDSFTPGQYGTSNKGYLGTSTASSPGHMSPSYGCIPDAGHDHFSTDLSTATLPSSSLYGGNGTNQLPGSRIPELSYQSPQDSNHDHSTVTVPPPSSASSQYDDNGTDANQSTSGLNNQPSSYSVQDSSSPTCARPDNTTQPHGSKLSADGELIASDDNVPEQKIVLEERPLSEHEKEVNYGAACRESLPGKTLAPEEMICLEENPVSDYGQIESLPDQALSQAHSCQERSISESNYEDKKPELKLCLEDNPLEHENVAEKPQTHGDNCHLTKGHRTAGSTNEQRTSDGNCPEKDTRLQGDESYLSPFPCSYDERARTDSAFFSVDSESKKPHSSEASPQSSDSELSNRNRSCDDVTMGTYDDIQETRM